MVLGSPLIGAVCTCLCLHRSWSRNRSGISSTLKVAGCSDGTVPGEVTGGSGAAGGVNGSATYSLRMMSGGGAAACVDGSSLSGSTGAAPAVAAAGGAANVAIRSARARIVCSSASICERSRVMRLFDTSARMTTTMRRMISTVSSLCFHAGAVARNVTRAGLGMSSGRCRCGRYAPREQQPLVEQADSHQHDAEADERDRLLDAGEVAHVDQEHLEHGEDHHRGRGEPHRLRFQRRRRPRAAPRRRSARPPNRCIARRPWSVRRSARRRGSSGAPGATDRRAPARPRSPRRTGCRPAAGGRG